MKKCSIVMLLLVLAVATILPVAAMAKEFKFTAIPDQDTARLQERFGKIADYLTEQLGFKVTYVPVKSYSASVQAFKNDDVQMAWFGGLSGVQARLAVPGSVAVAQGEEDEHFVSYLIAHHSTGLAEGSTIPTGVAGKTFTFGSKDSTSGRLMPEYYIREQFGKSPEELFATVGFSGDHSKTIALVQSGSFQIGAVNFKVWEKELAEGKIDTSKVTVIWKTPEYPDYNWTVRGDVEKVFGEGTIAKIQKALIEITDPVLLNAFPRKRFIPADNTMYQPILDTGRAIGIFR
ncbi:putative selenate ABC transporter substrate-binding protein [Desulfopila aestuarii]|uniref:Phosphonate transport system substrate-binding protein n=1 Tax=Desulfopila aestuarii DSM 18488 TaxID=1121416 RepID=A0A1M7XVG1_9BACT|nr:putative selenate ABC transporter substrate-binding protein [Desulfopila aestuarii]SHO42586.1 phosphonate transport system substrate-binding protein [Desulfopila aestuarii DSM 18488]